MQENKRRFKQLLFFISCSLLFIKTSLICSVIEMTHVTQHINKVFTKEDILDRSLFFSSQHPTAFISTFTLVNKRLYNTVHTMISEIITMLQEAKKSRTKYDCTALRKNWFVNQIHILDKGLHFLLLKECGKKTVTFLNLVTQGNLRCLNKCVNYFSRRSQLPVYTLSYLFDCLKYLKYYTFSYQDKFNLYEPYGKCTLM